ncbi:chemosensory receptor a [Plakobranchus ocellatus]|uniref:Chemosensory receptor a n=1 Tax=Plakobranchus ocellatus TaxID=259542 RepID=A0AAV4CA92_9GAST|nr:chemosensory receptor a [Plakobranchus ocellatus]
MYVHFIEEDNTTRYPALHQMTDNPFHLQEDHSKDSSMLTLASGLLSEQQFYIILLSMIYITQLITICAIIANSLSIAVFVKLGFSEPSNISLTVLAICDLTLAVLYTWNNLCFLLTYYNVRLPFHGVNVASYTGGTQWAFLSSAVAWITAFISFERCLCILFPLKVRRLITPRGTFVAMLLIILLTFCPSFFIYIRYKFVWVFNPYLNLTILNTIPVNSEFAILFEKISIVICGVIQPLLAFSIMLVCTVLLVVQLRKVSSWRLSVTSAKSQRIQPEVNPASSSSAAEPRISQKEERLVRMVVAIATIFIVSYIPTCISLLCHVAFEEFNLFETLRLKFQLWAPQMAKRILLVFKSEIPTLYCIIQGFGFKLILLQFIRGSNRTSILRVLFSFEHRIVVSSMKALRDGINIHRQALLTAECLAFKSRHRVNLSALLQALLSFVLYLVVLVAFLVVIKKAPVDPLFSSAFSGS